MATSSKHLIVALEEHYWDPDLVALFPGREGKRVSDVERRLLDMGEVRVVPGMPREIASTMAGYETIPGVL